MGDERGIEEGDLVRVERKLPIDWMEGYHRGESVMTLGIYKGSQRDAHGGVHLVDDVLPLTRRPGDSIFMTRKEMYKADWKDVLTLSTMKNMSLLGNDENIVTAKNYEYLINPDRIEATDYPHGPDTRRAAAELRPRAPPPENIGLAASPASAAAALRPVETPPGHMGMVSTLQAEALSPEDATLPEAVVVSDAPSRRRARHPGGHGGNRGGGKNKVIRKSKRKKHKKSTRR